MIKKYKATYEATPEMIVEDFLHHNKSWFTDEENGFFGKRNKFEKYLAHWTKTGEFGPDYDDNQLIYCEHKFESYLENNFEPIS